MRIVKLEPAENRFEVVPEVLDDLWHLERVIEKGDVVSGASTRKIKASQEGEEARRETLFVEIEAKEIEFHRFSGNLRVNGVLVGGKPEELIELKAHHALEIEPGRNVSVQKKALKKWQVDRLKKAQAASGREKLVVVVLDDEAADFAVVKDFGFEHKARIAAERQGKRYKTVDSGTRYFEEIARKVAALEPEKVVFAGPGFTKENLKKFLEDKGVKVKAFYEASNSTGTTGLNELLREGKIDAIVADLQLAKEARLVEEFMREVGGQKGLAEYGLEAVKKAVEMGAVQRLLVTDETLLEKRGEVESLMEKVERARGEVHIVSVGHEAGEKLQGFGGIGARLRYRLR